MSAFAARLVPARPDLAAEHLRGQVDAPRFVAGRPMRVTASLVELRLAPDAGAERATQLLLGEKFIVYETRPDGLVWGQAALDGYVGYVEQAGLGPAQGKGVRVTAIWSSGEASSVFRAAQPSCSRMGAAPRRSTRPFKASEMRAPPPISQ